MARSQSSSAPAGKRLKALPWAALAQIVLAAGKRWRALPEKDRERFVRLVRSSAGRPQRLSAKERNELRKLAGKLDLRGMSRELAGAVGKLRKGRGRSRWHGS